MAVSGQDIYKTPSGKKYHLKDCSTVKNVSEKITLEQAVKIGLEPCKVCHPPGAALSSSQNKAQGQTTQSVQCKVITKKGTRCLHKTHIGNGYCFQHQPK
jgi:hypothetical protein